MVYCVMQLNYWRHHGRLKGYQYHSLWKLLLWEWLNFLNLKGCLLTWVELYLYNVGNKYCACSFLQYFANIRARLSSISASYDLRTKIEYHSVLKFQNDMILVRKLEWFAHESLCVAQNGYHCARYDELCVVTWLKINQ